MSVFQFVQQSWIFCRMPDCQWKGAFSELEDHFILIHPQQIIHISNGSYFELTFDDLENQAPFLLSTNKGIYWFKMNDIDRHADQISRDIFAIGDSEKFDYYIKLGTFATRIMEILGPFKTKEENSDKYDFCMRWDYMERIKATMTPKVVIYFGDFEEEQDEIHKFINEESPSEISETIAFGCKYITFICTTCIKMIPGEPVLFKERYYLCSKCHHYALLYTQSEEFKNMQLTA